MKKIAVILSGCGFYDGAEIQEAVLTLLYITELGATYQCFAPDIAQHHVVDHITGEETVESRNVLTESARIARGDIQPLTHLSADHFDAIILLGGFGAAKNLCDFAFTGSQLTILPQLKQVMSDFIRAKKPIGMICIAPVMAANIFEKAIHCTIGNDKKTITAIEQMGAKHQACTTDHIVVDEAHKLVCTPAYMLAKSIGEAAKGIEKLVAKVIELANI